MRFWEENITPVDLNEVDTINDCEFEVDEICVLFKHWSNNIKSINEGLVIEIIQHFYTDLVVETNKYILHTRCKLWDKQAEVLNSLNLFKMQYIPDIDIDPYTLYCSQTKNIYNLLVSKQFYEKTIADIIFNDIELVFH